jgi:hypothetical protein
MQLKTLKIVDNTIFGGGGGRAINRNSIFLNVVVITISYPPCIYDFYFLGLHPVASITTIFGGAVNRNSIFSNVILLLFHKVILFHTVIKITVKEILLRLMVPPRL